MITIDTDTKYSIQGEIVRRREADGLVLALAESNSIDGDIIYTVYLCRAYTRNAGRTHEQRLEWLGFRDSAPSFRKRDEAIAYALEV